MDYVVSIKRQRDFEALSKMSGSAEIRIHYLNNPRPYFIKSFGWSQVKLNAVADSILGSSWFEKPDVIRCINPFVEAGIALSLSRKISVPIIVSVHGTYDRDPIRPGNLMDIFMKPFRLKLMRRVLSSATQVVGVYEDATNFAKRMGAKTSITIYNELGASPNISHKPATTNFNDVLRFSCVNRQDLMKDPRNIIRAISQIPKATFTLVGDGPLNTEISKLIKDLELSDRVKCIKAIPNDDWLKILAASDIYISHCDYAGVPKGVLEAGILGIPIITNRNNPLAPEFHKGWVSLCEDSVDSYLNAITDLVSQPSARLSMQLKANEFAKAHLIPANVRRKWIELYEQLVQDNLNL